MSIISWAARRQIEALSDSVSLTLGYISNPTNSCNMRSSAYNGFLQEHGLLDYLSTEDEMDHNLQEAMGAYIREKGNFAIREHKAPSQINDASYDFGQERSGAGWNKLANFVITSAFVRLLGATETFETDMLKALLYYRPNGLLGPDAEQIDVKADERVLREEPKMENSTDFYEYPPVWTWLRKHAYTNTERRKILKNVFKLENKIDGYNNSHIDEWYEMRNAIAHGRKIVELTLKDYCDVETYSIKVVSHYEEECKQKMRLII
ncbi:MAG: hypothetical protein GX265_06285 [Mollicutes bacterium]|nr:hypothetical protein [Mollicutes bacterium]